MDESARDPYGIRPPGHRLPGSTRLGTVSLQVADLGRSVDWYARVTGLRAVDRTSDTATLVTADDTPLVRLRERQGVTPAPRHGRLGLFHYAILLPDRSSLGRFARHLAGTGVRAGAADHHVSEALYLDDPDGLGIEVYADRPRTQWRHTDRQLVMATDPLDIPSLVAEAGAEPWESMPAGTVMGHVHLHVGDLELADGFYHAGLGLDRMVWNYPGALFLAAGGYHHHLGLNTWAAGADPAGEQDARLLEWELIVPGSRDIDAARESLAALGHGTEAGLSGDTNGPGDSAEPPHDPDAGLVVRDPWGTALRIRTA